MNRKLFTALSFISVSAIIISSFAGCSNKKQKDNNPNNVTYIESLNTKKMFSSNDTSSDIMFPKKSAKITLNGNSAVSESKDVKIKNNIITIKASGTYILDGTLSDGQVVVDADKSDKVQIVLNNASITSSSSSPVYVKQADKVFVTLNKDTVSTLSASGEFVKIDDNNIDAAIFSKDDLTVNGTGSLNITSAHGHGIVSKDDLVVSGGSLSINSEKHGLSGKQSVRIANGNLNIISGKDGIHAEDKDDASLGYVYIKNGSFDINAKGDGIDSGNILQIDSGTFKIVSGGGYEKSNLNNERHSSSIFGHESSNSKDKNKSEISVKGIKSDWNLLINGGDFTIDSCDDAIHSNLNLYVKGGNFNIISGDDALHADLTNEVSDVNLKVTKCYEGIEGMAVEIKSGNIDITSSDDAINSTEKNYVSSEEATTTPFEDFKPIKETYYPDLKCFIKISGGKITLNPGDDGLDSSTALYVTGGEIYINALMSTKCSAIDSGNIAQISGGRLFGTSGSRMAENFKEDSKQCAVLYTFKENQKANTPVTVKDSDGKVIATFTPTVDYRTVNISIPEFKTGKSYTISAGNSSEVITFSSTAETIGRERSEGSAFVKK